MASQEGRERDVVELAGARMPADHGLASLGLLMQLVGSLCAGAMVLVAVLPILSGAGGSMALFALGTAGALRSTFHRAAGTALLYGERRGALRPTYVYAGVAVAQTVLTILLLNQERAVPAAANLTAALVLLAWPAALLLLLTRPRLRALAAAEVLPVTEDLGFEGAAALMLLLGLVGAAVAALLLHIGLRAPNALGAEGMLVIGVFGMLLARSILHILAGARGTRGIDSDGATDAASRYFNFGVVSSVIAGGALLILYMNTPGFGLHPAALALVAAAVYLLLAWPLILRRFYTERNFAALLEGAQGPSYRRAPDAGMTAVGWLLLGLGVVRLGFSLPPALFGSIDGAGLLGAVDLVHLGLADLAGGSRSSWWSVGIGMTQVWAGLELVHMTDRHRLAATIYGAVAIAVALAVKGPGLEEMALFGMRGGDGFASVAGGDLHTALGVVIPAGVLLLANRKLLPAARARAPGSAPGE